jgi:hypothetical protein
MTENSKYETSTIQNWMERVRSNEEVLTDFISAWHPSKRTQSNMVITAPRTEACCETVRNDIRTKQQDLAEPEVRFKQAITDNNVDVILGLLSDAWFGVPESKDCWTIPGFAVACDLMDDPPEIEDEGNPDCN